MIDNKEYSFKKDSSFLVTEGAGFIGANLVEMILDLGYKVRVLDNFSTGKKEHDVDRGLEKAIERYKRNFYGLK